MGMIPSIEILSVCNVPTEMDMDDIFGICQDANQPGARVDYVPQDALECANCQSNKPVDVDWLRNGAVVVWKGHITQPWQLAEAVIKDLEGDEG
jgi:hypothetical protein